MSLNLFQRRVTNPHFLDNIACCVSNFLAQGYCVGKFGIGSWCFSCTTSRNCCLFRLQLSSSIGMMFNQFVKPGYWRISFALTWSLDIFSIILLRLLFPVSVLSFLMLFLILNISCLLSLCYLLWLMMRSTISPVSNLDGLYSASVLRWEIVTAIPLSRISRAMGSHKCSEIDDSPVMKAIK